MKFVNEELKKQYKEIEAMVRKRGVNIILVKKIIYRSYKSFFKKIENDLEEQIPHSIINGVVENQLITRNIRELKVMKLNTNSLKYQCVRNLLFYLYARYEQIVLMFSLYNVDFSINEEDGKGQVLNVMYEEIYNLIKEVCKQSTSIYNYTQIENIQTNIQMCVSRQLMAETVLFIANTSIIKKALQIMYEQNIEISHKERIEKIIATHKVQNKFNYINDIKETKEFLVGMLDEIIKRGQIKRISAERIRNIVDRTMIPVTGTRKSMYDNAQALDLKNEQSYVDLFLEGFVNFYEKILDDVLLEESSFEVCCYALCYYLYAQFEFLVLFLKLKNVKLQNEIKYCDNIDESETLFDVDYEIHYGFLQKNIILVALCVQDEKPYASFSDMERICVCAKCFWKKFVVSVGMSFSKQEREKMLEILNDY